MQPHDMQFELADAARPAASADTGDAPNSAASPDRPVVFEGNAGSFSVDAALIGELLDVAASDVQDLMRSGKITSRCERGEGEHAGQYRLTFFHAGRRARLSVDEAGRIIRRSVIDYGERPLPPALRRADEP